MVFLTEITLNNFKSFKGEHKVKIKSLIAIVGPNGSGKSNFTDAIGFAMGLSSSNLRVANMQQLIYRNINGDSPNEMSVKVILQAKDGTEESFERLVKQSNCIYYINDNNVPSGNYIKELKKFHLNPDVNDFVVFQNSIENLLEQTPKERTAMIEKISDSLSLASEYNRISAMITKHNQEMEHYVKKKKIISSEIKMLKNLENNAMEYREVEKEHKAAKETLALFDLYCIERILPDRIGEIQSLMQEISNIENEKYKLENTLAMAIQEKKESKVEIEALEREILMMEEKGIEFSKKRTALLGAIEYAESCVNTCRKSYEDSLIAAKVNKKTIVELQEALNLIEQKKAEHHLKYSKALLGTSQIDDSLTTLYEKLKKRYLENCATEEEKLKRIQREYQFLDDIMECSRRKMNEAKDALNRQLSLHRDTKERGDRLEKKRDEMRRELQDENQRYRDLSLKFRMFKEEEDKLVNEIDEIGKLEFDGEQVRQMRKKANIVKTLKEHFNGVYGRLQNMCEPIHERWEIAVNKVLGPHKNSIVVDTMDTGKACSNYLKQEALCFETFLPLDSLVVKPLKKRLRSMYEGTNVRLLYDVIKFSPPEISKAVLYATGNTLVTETTDEATRIAFDAEKGQRYDCIARQDGILYRKSGLMSGGISSRITISRYNSDEQASLQLHKEDLISKLRNIRRDAPTEEKLIETKATIQRLETRLKYLEDDCKKARNELSEIEMATWEFENKFDDAQAQWEKDKAAVESASIEIETLKSNIRVKENEIFEKFCAKLGIDNIFQYENGVQVYEETLEDLNNQIDRIEKQLEYERSMEPKLASKVETWKKKLKSAEEKLASVNEEMIDCGHDVGYDEIVKRITELEAIYQQVRKSSDSADNNIKQLRLELRNLSKIYLSRTRKLDRLKNFIQIQREKRRGILMEAKMNGVKIPMITNPASSVSQTRETNDSSSNVTITESSETCEDEKNIAIDFTKLPKVLLESEIDDAEKIHKELAEKVAELSSSMNSIDNPNVIVSHDFMDLVEKKSEIDRLIKETSKNLRDIYHDFDEIKLERYNRFMKIFERIQDGIGSIYKRLTGSDSAQAFLIQENIEEPYLGGIRYNCIAPGKRYCEIRDLSGGEKALASLSLLFALQSSESAHCQILDEVDAALDNRNVKKLGEYVRNIKEFQQTIFVSHKRQMTFFAEQIIGIASRRTPDGVQSRIFTLNLQPYRKK